jgi:hypothetical protein
MKTTKLIGAALALQVAMMTTGVADAFTQQECEKAWSKEDWAQAYAKSPAVGPPQPDFTCVRITEPFWVSLQGATRAQVIKAMKTDGKPFSDKELHFLSIPDGPVNFRFENDKAININGVTDDGQFLWNLTAPPDTPSRWRIGNQFACSDLPGSNYARCNK